MNNGFISSRMSPMEVFCLMTDGDAKSARALLQMARTKSFTLSDLLALDSMGIYGHNLYLFWRKYCKKNAKKMRETIDAFCSGKLSSKEIHEALPKK